MSVLKTEDFIGMRDDQHHYCFECAPAENVRPLIASHFNDEDVIVCDICGEIIA